MLRTLFTSDFFKNARYRHMKSPAEVVVGTLRQMGGYEIAMPGYGELSMQPSYMGQDLLNPPSVEGWHTGQEWINSGSLMARINFVAEQVGNPSLPGVQAIIKRLQAMGVLEPEELVDSCLDLLDRWKSALTPRRSWSSRRRSGARSAGTRRRTPRRPPNIPANCCN